MVAFSWTCSNCFSARSCNPIGFDMLSYCYFSFFLVFFRLSPFSSFLFICIWSPDFTVARSFSLTENAKNLLPLTLVLLTWLLFYYVHRCQSLSCQHCSLPMFSCTHRLNDFFFIALNLMPSHYLSSVLSNIYIH